MQLQTIVGKETLNAIIGETYVRQGFFYQADRANNKGYEYGDSTYGAQVTLTNPKNSSEVYALGTTANGKVTWAAAGILIWSFPASETAMWWFKEAMLNIDIVVPTNIYDPQGTRINLYRDVISVDQRN